MGSTLGRWWQQIVSCGRLLPAALTAVPLLFTACARKAPEDWPAIKKMVRDRFPDVPQVSTNQLAEWLKEPVGQRPVLLDARAADEYAVSHLQGALLAQDEDEALAALEETKRDQRIVVYCSVGYRSSALAERLRAKGYTNVVNLEGSIFAWANEGKPVYKDDQPATQVHPYDRKWGTLLNRQLWGGLEESK